MWGRLALTVRKVETAKPGRYTDGKGLMLLVKPSGARSWVLRYQLDGRRRDMGLGPYPEVTLAAAREKALRARRQLVDGIDPLTVEPARVMTFRAAADELIESKQPGWRNPKHAKQWPSTLNKHVYPMIGELSVDAITTEHVLSVLRPIWTKNTETASRVRQRIEAVIDYAASKGMRDGPNPARWRGHLQNILPKPSSVRAVRHHPAMDWRDLPEFMVELADRDGVSARALSFLILTAARSGEVRGMRWGEIDRKAKVWTVPADRMKAGKEHRVPLSDEAIAVLGAADERDQLVFPTPSDANRALSDMALTSVLRKMGQTEITVHGFRSTFRDWAGETTSFPREVIEAALAHRLKDKAEAAYARGDLFNKRCELMEAWSRFAEANANVDSF
ncbi:MAG: integrase arm-type DNA-binding domain-containing protein [Pseudomonadota bacterium]